MTTALFNKFAPRSLLAETWRTWAEVVANRSCRHSFGYTTISETKSYLVTNEYWGRFRCSFCYFFLECVFYLFFGGCWFFFTNQPINIYCEKCRSANRRVIWIIGGFRNQIVNIFLNIMLHKKMRVRLLLKIISSECGECGPDWGWAGTSGAILTTRTRRCRCRLVN